MSLGSRLRAARRAKKLTQKQLGDMAQVTGSAIGNYETGVSSPNEDILIRLMHVLDVDANYLYADDMAAIKEARFLSPDEERLITVYRHLNASGQQMAMTALESFAGNPALTEEAQTGAS